MGVDNYKHVYAQPNASSPIVGETYFYVAAGPDIGRFTKTYLARGKIGFVKSQYVHPFYDKYSPGSICTFEGVQPNGVDLFDVGPAK